MKLWYYRGTAPNFGDELNTWLWPRVMGSALDDDDAALFLGIGSILFNRFDPAVHKVVFGSGFGGYSAPPDLHDGGWNVRFVRGPQTARLLDLDRRLVGFDPAILIHDHVPLPAAPGTQVSFMPHWESLERGHWQDACKLAGITMIDPRDPPATVIAQISASRLVISEAMHGAIVADALRVPWVPAMPIHPRHRMKWRDWAESLGIELRPQFLAPSSLEETHLALPRHRPLRGVVRVVKASPARNVAECAATHAAAHSLRRAARAEPSLSSDAALARALDRLNEEVYLFCKSVHTVPLRKPLRLRLAA